MNQFKQTIQEYNRRTMHYFKNGNYAEALLYCNKTLEIDPNNMEALGWLPNLYQYLGEYEKAVIVLTKILDSDPNNSAALIERGYSYDLNNEYENALNDYLAAIDIDGEDTFCDLFVPEAKEWCKKGKYNFAIKLYDKLIEKTYDDKIKDYRREAYRRQNIYENRKG